MSGFTSGAVRPRDYFGILTITGGLQLWLTNRKEGQITSSYDFNAASPNPSTIYVEGRQTGEGSVILNWQPNAGATVQPLDTVYYNVWQVTGAANTVVTTEKWT